MYFLALFLYYFGMESNRVQRQRGRIQTPGESEKASFSDQPVQLKNTKKNGSGDEKKRYGMRGFFLFRSGFICFLFNISVPEQTGGSEQSESEAYAPGKDETGWKA